MEPAEDESAPAEAAPRKLDKNKLTVIVVAAVAILLAIVVVALGLRGAKQKVDNQKLTGFVTEATAELRQALAAAPSADSVARLDAVLAKANTVSGNPAADNTEVYVLGAREITRRRVEVGRLQREVAASRQALAAHMGRAERRGPGGSWLQTAVSLKRKVEADYADLGRALKTLDDLLGSLGETERRLAPYVPAAAMLDEATREGARARAQADAKAAADELEKVRRLTP